MNESLQNFIWDGKYRYKDQNGNPIDTTIEDTWKRVAQACASLEKEKDKWTEKFYSVLEGYKFLPGGRILSNAGTSREKTTMFNCFVMGEIKDDTASIFETVKEAALTQRQGGGVGYDFSTLRPNGAWVHGVQAKASGPISFMHVFDATCQTIMSAGNRRGAQLAAMNVSHTSIEDFIDAKRDGVSLKMFNLSVAITDKFMEAVEKDADWDLGFNGVPHRTVKARYLWNKIMKSTYDYAEPGVIFIDKYNKMNNLHYCEQIKTTNPCVVGSTLIAVADGRNAVSIEQLAKEGKDVPVYCIDNDKKITVRLMRNPRITGYKQPVYKVSFDDGNSITCTNNHKFLTTDFEYKTVENLKIGDALHIATKYQAPLEDIFKHSNSKSQDYWWIQNQQTGKLRSDHRMIYEYHFGVTYKDFVIHHKDRNGRNNKLENLERMSKRDHDKLHGDMIKGEKNPMVRAQTEWDEEKWQKYHNNMSASVSGEKNGMYAGRTLDQLKEELVIFLKQIGRNCSVTEWSQYCTEKNIKPFAGIFRNNKYHDFCDLIKEVCEENNILFVSLGKKSNSINGRILRRIDKEMLQAEQNGYEYKIENDCVLVKRICETCKKEFWTRNSTREIAYCKQSCAAKANRNKQIIYAKFKRKTKNEEKLQIQAKFYYELKQKYGRNLIAKEWINECKKYNIDYKYRNDITKCKWSNFLQIVNSYNHKIINIEFVGYEDVYNGTVDEFHNFYCALKDTKEKKEKYFFINNLQCGEQGLPPYGACLLGSINLTKFVEEPFSRTAHIDYKKLSNAVSIAVRMLDNVIELSKFPLPQQEKQVKQKRRMGFGITGLGDVFAFLRTKYGSQESLDIASEIMKTITETAYEASIELAKEKGSFPAFEKEKYLESNFIKTLPKRIQKGIEEHGIRNSHLISIAPTGTISLLAGNVSSGLEPIFATSYIRKIKTEDGGEKQEEVVDYAASEYRKKFKTDDLPNYFVTTAEITPAQHLAVQATLQKYVDSSISKTINVPENIPFEEFQNIYLDAYKAGLKGCTTYRPNSNIGSILTKKGTSTDGFRITEELERPIDLPCDIHIFQCGGENWTVFIGKRDGLPYEIFAGLSKEINIPTKYSTANIIKRSLKVHNSKYDLYLNKDTDNEIVFKNITHQFKNDVYGAMTRMLSGLLRKGMHVKYIYEMLEKEMPVEWHSFYRGIMRVLKKYIRDGEKGDGVCDACGSTELIYQGGCKQCMQCGNSKCL